MRTSLFSTLLLTVFFFMVLLSFDFIKSGMVSETSLNRNGEYLPKEVDHAVEQYYLQSSFSEELIGVRFNKTRFMDNINSFIRTYEANHPDDFGVWEIFPKLIRYNINDSNVVNYLTMHLCSETGSGFKCTVHVCQENENTTNCHYQLVSHEQMLEHYKDKYSMAIQLLKGGVKLEEPETDAQGMIYDPNINFGSICPSLCP